MTTPKSWVRNVKHTSLLMGAIVALGSAAPAAHANARRHRINVSQSNIQIAIQNIWAPAFAFVWGTGNTVAIVFAPINQTVNQSATNVVIIGGNAD